MPARLEYAALAEDGAASYGSVDEEAAETCWSFADHGKVGQLSRDGSIHVTDEVFNSASHLAGAMLSVLGFAVLVSEASAQGAPWKIVSFAAYGLSLVLLFVASTLHHAISSTPRVMQLLRMLDYMAIYPLIAGTFTPMCLVFFHRSPIGWTFFGVVWSLSVAGMALTVRHFHKMPKWISMTLYMSLGWLGAFLSIPLYAEIGSGGVGLLALGGLFYTVGGVCFTIERPNPIPGRFGFHEIWHIFVLLGAGAHWLMMMLYVLPWHAGGAASGST